MTDTEFMGKWFAEVTQPQHVHYNQRMADAAPYRNSPRWARARSFAQREFHEATADARKVYEQAMDELEALGEISEETDFALTQFKVAQTFAAPALSPDLMVIKSCLERTL
jgi:hypothetical protein